MQTLLVIHEADIDPQMKDLNPIGFSERLAARAVVLDESGGAALLRVGNKGYHKLPGGGVEPGENMQQALMRELLEEIGCEVNVTAVIGAVIEYRDQWQMKQTSECYLAQKKGEPQSPSFTAEEISDGFEIVWMHSIDDAISIIEQDNPTDYDGRFIQCRDMALLKAAKKLV
jgi:8-oxo-dGTP diphosphatase